jgi:hypothetical protein
MQSTNSRRTQHLFGNYLYTLIKSGKFLGTFFELDLLRNLGLYVLSSSDICSVRQSMVFLRSVNASTMVDLLGMWIARLSLASSRDFRADLNISVFLDQ